MKLYICGDSFSSTDPDYPGAWTELLQDRLSNTSVTNLSSPAASNYLIYLQVKKALENNCDYLIYNATSSVRYEFILNKNFDEKEDLDRYWNLSRPAPNKSMISISWVNPHNTASEILSKKIIKQHSDYFDRYIDLLSLVEKNYIFIQHTLQLLSNSGITWAWNRGGFGHKRFGNTQPYNFSNWLSKESTINLWDYYDSSILRPYYHVTDYQVHQNVCKEYINLLKL